MTIQRIKLKDLNQHFLEQLRKVHGENIELAIWLPETRSDQTINELDFWKIIDLLNWEEANNFSKMIEPAVDALQKYSISDIKGFSDILSEKLYLLDGQKYAEHTGKNSYEEDQPFSADEFLYARCFVVAKGQKFYTNVLNTPSSMPKDLSFENLLSIPREAYKKKTGQKFDYTPAYIIETFANSDGWGGQSLFDKILS